MIKLRKYSSYNLLPPNKGGIMFKRIFLSILLLGFCVSMNAMWPSDDIPAKKGTEYGFLLQSTPPIFPEEGFEGFAIPSESQNYIMVTNRDGELRTNIYPPQAEKLWKYINAGKDKLLEKLWKYKALLNGMRARKNKFIADKLWEYADLRAKGLYEKLNLYSKDLKELGYNIKERNELIKEKGKTDVEERRKIEQEQQQKRARFLMKRLKKPGKSIAPKSLVIPGK